jgi:hypothetical protein
METGRLGLENMLTRMYTLAGAPNARTMQEHLLILADSYQVLQHLNRFASVIEKRMF